MDEDVGGLEDLGPGLDARHLEELRERIRQSAFHQWVGLELVSVGDGECELNLELRPHHFNPQGIVHGGIITAVADTSIGLALRSRLRTGFTHRTAELNVHFLAKGEGGRVHRPGPGDAPRRADGLRRGDGPGRGRPHARQGQRDVHRPAGARRVLIVGLRRRRRRAAS